MIHTLWPEVNNALRRGAEAASSFSDEKTGHPKLGVLFHSGAGNEARARFPASREWLTAIRRTPASPLIQSRLRRGAEAASSLSDEKTEHPKLGVLFHSGAGNEARTRYLHLGKVALYQMSYARKWCPEPESNQRHGDFQSPALPTELSGQIFSAPHGAGGELQPQGDPRDGTPSRGRWRPGTGSNRRPLA